MDINDHSKLYDAYYYSHGCGKGWGKNEAWFQYMDLIADRILSDIQPATVLDAGCGMGHLVGALRQKGIQAYGLDLSEFAIGNAPPEVKPYCWVGSITEPFPQKYDLIICAEVMEHLPRVEAEKAVRNLCHHSQDILFSSTPYDYKEATHFNVQPPDYWAEAFARQGFVHDIEFDASFVTPWAARFCHNAAPMQQIVRNYERQYWLLWRQSLDLRNVIVEIRKELSTSQDMIHNLEGQLSDLRSQAGADPRTSSDRSIINDTLRRIMDRLRRMIGGINK
jgi:SAM-dependent methyltransferase